MPRRNTVKIYISDGIYHIYNRGVDKRKIFLDDEDYKVFLRLLKDSLSPQQNPKKSPIYFSLQGSTLQVKRLPKNFNSKVLLLGYCLMPNHFHLLIKQKDKIDMKEFMRSIITRYSMYFNKKYDRVGSLFQSIYKAVLVMDESYLLHLSRYIHRNPLKINKELSYSYSSYLEYLKRRNTSWIDTNNILSIFKNEIKNDISLLRRDFESYQKFVEDADVPSERLLGNLIIDNALAGFNPAK